MSAAPDPERRGRPRDPEVDRAILEAAKRLLFEVGFARMSIAAVAAAAGVGKAAIYRRYRDKAELAIAAVAAAAPRRPVVEGEDVRAFLVAMVAGLRRKIDQNMALLGTMLAEEHHNPALLAQHRERVIGPRRADGIRALERAVERGEVRPDADLEATLDMLVGAVFARYLSDSRLPADWPERVVDVVLAGIAPHGA